MVLLEILTLIFLFIYLYAIILGLVTLSGVEFLIHQDLATLTPITYLQPTWCLDYGRLHISLHKRLQSKFRNISS